MSSPVPNPIAADAFVARIHASETRLVLAITGGGSQAISTLLGVPGGSRTLLAATVPYSSAALVELLGTRPEHFCDNYTARLMAMAAYQQAVRYAQGEGLTGPLAGVACTASLASDRPERGPHRIHVAAQTAEFTAIASLELVKGARDRHQEELLAAQLLLNMVARACGLTDRVTLDLQDAEQVVEDDTVAPPKWHALFAGELNAVLVENAVATKGSPSSKPRAVFPGAFHPLHAGHLSMARIATQRLATPVAWELSILNVDKPPLDFHEMRLRSEQFAGKDLSAAPSSLWLTRAPTFVEKAGIFPGATFVVGVDTIERIAEPRYYRNDLQACQAALASIAAAGCRFLVFGRQTAQGFETLANLKLPLVLRDICDEVPEAEFRADISSTKLRQDAGGD